jgi:hypothetical protein
MNMRRVCDVIRLRLRSLFGRGRVEQELDRELGFHLDQEVRENMERGMPADEARLAAMRRLGGVSKIQEECRDMRRTNQLEPSGTTCGTRCVSLAVLRIHHRHYSRRSRSASRQQRDLQRDRGCCGLCRTRRRIASCGFFNSDTYAKFPLNPFDFRDFRARNRFRQRGGNHAERPAFGTGRTCDAACLPGDGRFPGAGLLRRAAASSPPRESCWARLAILSDRLCEPGSADPNIIGRTITLDAQPLPWPA